MRRDLGVKIAEVSEYKTMAYMLQDDYLTNKSSILIPEGMERNKLAKAGTAD
jgi:hypothetical protein